MGAHLGLNVLKVHFHTAEKISYNLCTNLFFNFVSNLRFNLKKSSQK